MSHGIICDGMCHSQINGKPAIVFIDEGGEKPPQKHLCPECYKRIVEFMRLLEEFEHGDKYYPIRHDLRVAYYFVQWEKKKQEEQEKQDAVHHITI